MLNRSTWVVALVAALVIICSPPLAVAGDKLSKEDKDFIKDATRNLQTSTQAARIARDQATDSDVKKFADQLISGDDKMIDELRGLAEKDNFKFTETPSKPDEKRLSDLKGMKGADFDKHYVSAALHDQEELLKIFKDGGEKAKNDDLQQWFKKKDDAIRSYATTARELNRRLNGDKDHDKK